MGLGISLSNALSGMNTSQDSLDVLSRNVANAGTPGYHRQSLSVIDTKGANSVYARSGGIERAFSQSLQAYYTRSTSDAGYTHIRATVLDRLQTYLGVPGGAGSLDTMFANLQNSLQQLATSPDNYATRATVISEAQGMAETLNALTGSVQSLRQETEAKIASNVDSLNQAIGALAKINRSLGDQNGDLASRAALLDQRDRLVTQISEFVDLKVDYRADGTVGLITRSGVGILDVKASVFEFQAAGSITADQQYSTNPDSNGVGRLVLNTPSGEVIDLVGQRALKSGELAGLIELRDTTLVAMQDQLDDIAAGLAQAFSTVKTAGTATAVGAADGFELDFGNIRNGNDFLVNYSQNGVDKALKVMRVDDPTKLPMDYVDASGTRVIGVDFAAGPTAVTNAVRNALGTGFNVSNPSGNVIRILDDGAAGTTAVTAVTGRTTATGLQNGDLGINLFVDYGNADFTNSLDGEGQKRGFAGRIAVNTAIVADNKLLVQFAAGGSLGDGARADYLVSQLETMEFSSIQTNGGAGSFRLSGSVSDMIAQTLDHAGSITASALSDQEVQQYTMNALDERVANEYGVNVDEEMARLMELQNAYAANARVISVVQELLDRLMDL